MKTKRLVFISCLAAGALIASPASGEMHKKSMAASASKPQRMAPRTTQVTPTYRHVKETPTYRQGISSQMGGTRYYTGARYGGTGYYGGTRYYGGGYPYSSYYSGWPYSYWDYPSTYSYSYYTPAYGYDASMVAAVQRRLGELGYYHGVVDGIMGPRTRAAIAAYESTHGLVADGMITPRLLDRMGLA